ncbi:MAG: ATP-binding protein [bacterium]|nr:ATP-binding protein [bacterium]
MPIADSLAVSELEDAARYGLRADVPLSSQLHREYGRRDGLPSPWINDIVQTRDGHIWAATDNGLARYDGLRFQVYDRAKTPQLSHHEIRTLCEDHEGILWIGTTRGLTRYKPGRPGAFARVDEIAETIVHEIYEDNLGSLWVGTQDLTYVKTQGGRFQPLTEAPRNVRAVCLDSAGTLWMGANSGLYRREDSRFRQITHKSIPPETGQESGLHESRVNVLFEDEGGDLWIGANRTLLRIHDGEFLDRRPELDPQQIYDLLQTPDGSLYIAARFGVFRIDSQGKFEQASDRVSAFCLLQDHDGRLWLGHGDNRGLHCFQNDYSERIWDESPARCLWEDRDGSLWLGTKYGLHHFGKNHEKHIGEEDGLPDACIQTIFPAADGQLWIGTRRGLVKYADGEVVTNSLLKKTLDMNIGVGLVDARGDVWLGLDVMGGQAIRDGELIELDELGHGKIHWFWENSDGVLWIGHEAGLYQAHARTITKMDVPAIKILQQPRLLCHAVASDGSLWIGTSNGLLLHRNGQFVAIPPEAGLQADNIERLATDSQGNLWFGGRDGLFFLDVKQLEDFVEGQIETLVCGRVEGFERFPPLSAFSQGCIAQHEALWILGESGLVRLPLRQVLHKPKTPEVTIESALLDGRVMDFEERCEFLSGNRRLTIQFAAPYFDSTWPIQLRFRLEGHDDRWIDADDSRLAQYTGLKPGNYRFLVNARSGNDAWSKSATSMLINVRPRWWETRWFFVLAPAALVLATFGLTWQYLSQIRAHNLQLLGEIDKRLGTERQLQKSEISFRALAESTRAIPWEADAEPFHFTFFGNQIAEILGYSVEDCLQEGFWQTHIVPQDLTRVSKSIQQAVELGQDYQIDCRVKAADGRIVHLQNVVHVVKQAGQVRQLGGFMIDVSAKRAAEESARSSLRQLARLDRIAGMGEVAASIAHEVNQPLFAIVSNAETALRLLSREFCSKALPQDENGSQRPASEEPPGCAAGSNSASREKPASPTIAIARKSPGPNMEIVREALEDIVSDGNRASQIIHHIRSQVRQEPHPPELLDMNQVVRECADFAESELRRRGFALRFQFASDLPEVCGSKVELQQVLLNLIINAVHACEAAEVYAEIVIVTAAEHDRVLVSVVDQGIGIDEAQSQRLFDAFYTTKPQGTGIGLAVSRTIVESIGGRIWASSNAEQGATFHFSLPTAEERNH